MGEYSYLSHRMKRIAYLVGMITLLSCKNAREPQPMTADSLVSLYLSSAQYLQEIDTTDFSFRLLRAYRTNDTSYIIDALKALDPTRRPEFVFCAGEAEPRLANFIDRDAYYQFVYHSGANDQTINLRIEKETDSIYLECLYFCDTTSRTFPPPLKLWVKKTLSDQQLQLIQTALKRADFWGAHHNNDTGKRDESVLQITAFERLGHEPRGRLNNVIRWSPGQYPLGSAFRTVLDVAGLDIPFAVSK
jgi:hypothetical protein